MAAKTPLKPAAKKARYCAVFVPNKYKFYAQFWLILKYKKRHGGAVTLAEIEIILGKIHAFYSFYLKNDPTRLQRGETIVKNDENCLKITNL